MAFWIVRHSPFLKEYFLMKKLFQKRFIWVQRNKKQTVKSTHYDWSSLTNSDIRNQYIVTMRNKFDTHQETSERHTQNEDYENFVTTHIEAVIKSILIKPRAKCWVPWESIVVRKKQVSVKNSSLLNKRNPINASVQNLKKAQRWVTHTKKNN